MDFVNRIIPADAGSTWTIRLDILGVRDHPRRCGEHEIVELLPPGLLGSSPQMRGAPPSWVS